MIIMELYVNFDLLGTNVFVCKMFACCSCVCTCRDLERLSAMTYVRAMATMRAIQRVR